MERNNNRLTITITDLIVINTLCYLYYKNQRPVTIPEIVEELKIPYCTVAYSIQKFEKIGIIERILLTEEEEYSNKERGVPPKYAYAPKINYAYVLREKTLLVLIPIGAIPITILDNNVSVPEPGSLVPIDQLPKEVQEMIFAVFSDTSSITIFAKILKKKYLELRFKEYLNLREKMLSE